MRSFLKWLQQNMNYTLSTQRSIPNEKKNSYLFCKYNAAPHAKGCCTLHYYLQYTFVLSWEKPKKSPHVFDIIALFSVQLCDCNYNSTLKSTVPKTEYLSTKKTSILWVIRRIVLTWEQNDFILVRKEIKWAVNIFRHLKKWLMRSKCIFWRYLNQSDKSAPTIVWTACKNV